MSKKFCDLEIWQEGYNLLMEIYEISLRFPREEVFSLTSQIRRSANSIIANIAEAHGRYYFADKVRILYISRSEIEETQSHLRVALGRKYISEEKFSDLDLRYENLNKKINQYITYLRRKKAAI